MKYHYEITIIKRTPKTEEELNRMYESQKHNFGYNQLNGPVDSQEYIQSNVLCTVLTEEEFKNIRLEVLKTWEGGK